MIFFDTTFFLNINSKKCLVSTNTKIRPFEIPICESKFNHTTHNDLLLNLPDGGYWLIEKSNH